MSAVTYDAAVSETFTTTIGTAQTRSLAFTTSGSNRAIIVGVDDSASPDSNITPTGVTYAGQSLTKLGPDVHSNNGTAGLIQMWGLANCAVGNNNIVLTYNNVNNVGTVIWGAISLNNTDQSSGSAFIRTTATTASTVTNPALVVSSAVDDMIVDIICNGASITSKSGTNQTSRWLINIDNSTAARNAAMSTTIGSSSETIGYYATQDWSAIIAVSVKSLAANNVDTLFVGAGV